MTEAALAPPPEADRGHTTTLRLRSLLRPEFLIEFGWDAEQLIAQPSADHPLLGYTVCRVNDCDAEVITVRDGLCGPCRSRWRARGQPLEDYLASWRRPYVGTAGPCSVSRCERHWVSYLKPLCRDHNEQKRRWRITSIEELIACPRSGHYPTWDCAPRCRATGSARIRSRVALPITGVCVQTAERTRRWTSSSGAAPPA